MTNKLNANGGYSGIFLLLITFALIIFFVMLQLGVFAKKDEATGQTKIQRDLKAIDDAKALKNVMEQQSRQQGTE